ncbi:hypothetical protein [Streptomyces sp. BBFR109]|uniref:hypothetical protein n=1 Tax=Streptomyces sp. BBFR109 TaxID=3448172 RepID=UPI003F7728CD
MAEIKHGGQKLTSTANGRLRIEEGNNRLISNDGTTDVLLIGDKGDGTITVDLALPGVDVKDADINDLVFSSRFNLYKIIHLGGVSAPTPRNATVTLSGNNIGYVFEILIDLFDNDATQKLTGDLLMNICWDRLKVPIRGSGVFYDDGTNKVNYKWSCGNKFNTQYIFVKYELRLMAGSYSFNPFTSTRVPFRNDLYYQVANMTQDLQSGGGVTGPGDGKFYFKDVIAYYPDGSVKTALASTTEEFINGDWAYFPAAV